MSSIRPRVFAAIITAAGLALAACSSSSGSSSAPAATQAAPADSSAPTTQAPAGDAATPASGDTATTAAAGTPTSAAAPIGGGGPGAYTPTGQLIADDGFRPETNGFKFENYGPVPDGGSNMTPDDVRSIFGDGVCADAKSGKCDLNPQAQQWMDQTNAAMGGGHCYGFAETTQLLWMQTGMKPADFGADATNSLTIAGNLPLQRRIAINWAYQVLDTVQAARVMGSPKDIVEKLKTALVPNPTELYVVAFFNGKGGHAVTPYALEDAGNGIVNILVYDNNWPGVTRAVKVDTNANTWEYVAALNPQEPSEVYSGDASTQNLMLYPTSPALPTQPCPFCGNVPGNASGGGSTSSTTPAAGSTSGFARNGLRSDAPDTVDIYLDATSETEHGHLLITNPDGKRVGFVDGKLVNEIDGAQVTQPMSDESWKVSMEPIYTVPDGVEYTITLDGSELTANDVEELTVIGSSYEMSVSGISLDPGEHDTLVVAPYAEKLAYTATGAETPTFELGVSDESADYTFTVSGAADLAGSTTVLGLPAEGGQFTIDTADSDGTSNFDLTMERIDDNGVLNFSHSGIELAAQDSATLQFGAWTQDGDTIPLVIHQNGTDTTQELTDSANG